MSFHGGLLGVLFAMWLYGRRTERPFWRVMDFHRAAGAAGAGCCRAGNFINAELPGRAVDPSLLPWAMVFPHVDQIPRYPSQLYQFFAEGVVLFVLVWLFCANHAWTAASRACSRSFRLRRTALHHRILPRAGQLPRLPRARADDGQWLCVPLMLIGLVAGAAQADSSRPQAQQTELTGFTSSRAPAWWRLTI